MTAEIIELALTLGDDALVLGHRLSEWSSKAPSLEEDIALSNLGLDMLGQARLFYQLAARVEGKGRDEDTLAYFRNAEEFRNVLLVELPKGDFAFTMARQLAVSAFLHFYYDRLACCAVPELAEIGAKAVKEMAYHVRHSAEWVIRLGDGTEESRRRMVRALEDIWPYAGEMFEIGDFERHLVAGGQVPDRLSLRRDWDDTMRRVIGEATLNLPPDVAQISGGRTGRHTPDLAVMLADMQSLARAYPGVTW